MIYIFLRTGHPPCVSCGGVVRPTSDRGARGGHPRGIPERASLQVLREVSRHRVHPVHGLLRHAHVLACTQKVNTRFTNIHKVIILVYKS